VRLQDFRDFGDQRESVGAFDAVGSIEMGEHVGEQWCQPTCASCIAR
jgi:cyclopropane-fatty-acyl-phospholipid synthase